MVMPDGHTAATCVAVYDEPEHRVEVENDHVYAYRVRLAPGQTTLWHRHTEDTVYFALAAARGQEELATRAAIVTEIPCGIAVSRPHRSEPLVHKVTNLGDDLFHMIGAEAHARPAYGVRTPRVPSDREVVLETPRFVVHRLRPGPAVATWHSTACGLLVALAPCVLQSAGKTHLDAGALRWVAPFEPLELPTDFDGFFAQWR